MTPAQIRDARCSLNMTQQQFADALDVDIYTVQRWESGHCSPRARLLYQIQELLGKAQREKFHESSSRVLDG